MKILQIVDTYGWAIDTLSKAVVDYNTHYKWRRTAVHPKKIERGELTMDEINLLKKNIEWCDVIDAQYWRTLSQLAEMFPAIKGKKVMLTHHNEKNLLSEDWSYVDMHIAKTEYSFDTLKEKYGVEKIKLIYNSFDPDRFPYLEKYPPEEPAVGYVGRIVPWKGLKNIAKVCYELKYRLMILGKMDKPSYYDEIPKEHQDNIDFSFLDCTVEDVPDFYKNITIYVGNSGSGREVGTLGFIEALASGVPVITTPAGMAKDIVEDDEHCIVIEYDDYEGLKYNMKNLMEHPQLQNRLRQGGWDAIRHHNDEAMALEYRKVFDNWAYDDDLVSVIVPATQSREDLVLKILDGLALSTYKNFEVVLCWDELYLNSKPTFNKNVYDFAIKEIVTGKAEGYNLAMSRNLGVIDADGSILMFCDSRMLPKPDAIEKFFKTVKGHWTKKIWHFGEKGGNKPHFVENFSAIRRDLFIQAGMMNERISEYGGMSQELRERFGAQGFEFKYHSDIEATQLKSGRKNSARRRSIINMKNLLKKLYG